MNELKWHVLATGSLVLLLAETISTGVFPISVKLRYRSLSVWPYTVEICTLREASPVKQSVKGRVAGSATTEERARMKMLPTVASRHFNPMLLLQVRGRVE